MSPLTRLVFASVALCWTAGCLVPVESDESGDDLVADSRDIERRDADDPLGDGRSLRSNALQAVAAGQYDIESPYAYAQSEDDGPGEDDALAARAQEESLAGPDPDPWHLSPVDGDPDDDDEEAGPDPDPWEPWADAASAEDDG